jgi:hypothetical protein
MKSSSSHLAINHNSNCTLLYNDDNDEEKQHLTSFFLFFLLMHHDNITIRANAIVTVLDRRV